MRKQLLFSLFFTSITLFPFAQALGQDAVKKGASPVSSDDLLKILIAPIIAALIQWWTSKNSKARLKIDIELLELYKKIDDTSEDYKYLKGAITARLKKAYKVEEESRDDADWSDALWGLALSVVIIVILLDWITKDNAWKVSITGGFGLGAVFAFYKAFKRPVKAFDFKAWLMKYFGLHI